MSRHPFTSAARLVLPALIVALGSPVLGQSSDPRPDTKKAPSRAAGAVELADRPLVVPGLGLRMYLPVGAKYETTQMSGASAGFTMQAPDGDWRMILHDESSRDTTLGAEEIADHLIRELRSTREFRRQGEQEAIGSAVELLDREPRLTINDRPASRFYIRTPSGKTDFVSGYTVFQVAPGRFAIFQMDTLAGSFQKARAAYETVIATARFRDPTDVAAERAAGVKTGAAFLQSLTREDIEAILPFESWRRIYRPAPTGARADATELGYERVEARIGKRGELNPDRPRRRWTSTDQEEGFLVRVTGRVLEGDRIVDADSHFFLSFDRSDEAWAVRMAVRIGGDAKGWTETGVRRAGEIEVAIDQPAQPPLQKQWQTPPEAYLSQVGGFLLPRLLVQHGAPGVYNFYRYQSSLSEITLRRDVLELVDETAESAWRLRSRTDENAPEHVVLLDKDGDLIRRKRPGGVIAEPISLEALKSLWTAKNLPLK